MKKDVVERAKETSRRRGKSLSRLVEEQLEALAATDAKKHSYVKEMSGALKDKIPAQTSIKEAKGRYLKAKHGL